MNHYQRMNSFAVIGLGFGDEGKGLTVDYLCSRNPGSLVVRYSGGQQAGHTVVVGEKKHVFSNFGSGTLRGIPTYWSRYCTFDPVGFINELSILTEKGIAPFIYINDKCPVTTPFDKKHNASNDFNNGTCGVGVGSTIKREEDHYSLLFEDLFYPFVLKSKLKLIQKYYNINTSLDRFNECIDLVVGSKNIFKINCIPPQYKNYIFEGSQGLLLDQNMGFFPHVTRSNTGSRNIIKMGYNPELYLVTRAYQTRHGNGVMSNENIPHNIAGDTDETNVFNEYQGEFRRTLLDIDLIEYAINKDEYIRYASKNLVITCLDHVQNDYRFTYKNEIITSVNEDEFVGKISKILHANKTFVSHSSRSENIKQI